MKNQSLKVSLHELNQVDDSVLTRVVCVCLYKNKWVFCKKKETNTWEIPGGHIEENENWLTAAKRELFEETGATDVEIFPVCLYSISTYGKLCFAKIKTLEKLPNFEMKEIGFFDDIPNNLTYPETHTLFFETVKNFLKNNK
ncbi:MAG: NUDIX domain-containing protein [Clostridia bacterium]|nr:NUDIX domain-containing protein [Clostridia bacterium]